MKSYKTPGTAHKIQVRERDESKCIFQGGTETISFRGWHVVVFGQVFKTRYHKPSERIAQGIRWSNSRSLQETSLSYQVHFGHQDMGTQV